MEDNSQQGVVHNTCARTYGPSIGRWLTQDPMAEKYYAMTPYNYCAGNPVRYVDPDGKKIVFAKGSTDEFKTKFAEAVEYMNKCGTSYNIAALGKSEQVYLLPKENITTIMRIPEPLSGSKCCFS